MDISLNLAAKKLNIQHSKVNMRGTRAKNFIGLKKFGGKKQSCYMRALKAESFKTAVLMHLLTMMRPYSRDCFEKIFTKFV